MSLNHDELRRTSVELQHNLRLSGLTEAEVAADLGLTPDRLRAVLRMSALESPAEAWLLRDYLEQAVRDAGGEPVPFTVLTERSRRMAEFWFGLREAPRHVFAA